MKNTIKLFGVLSVMVGLMWLSKQHNDTFAAAPYSNIRTTRVNSLTTVIINDGTNLYFLVQTAVTTNHWPGPTNNWDLRTNHYSYSTLVPISITGYAGADLTYAWNSMLKIYNASDSNITILLPDNTRLPIGDTNGYVLTNGDIWIGSVDYSDGQTNIVTKMWH